MALRNNHRLFHALEAYVILFCALADAVLIYGVGVTEVASTSLIGMGTDMAGVILCCILFTALYLDRNTNLHMELLMALLVTETIMLTCNTFSWFIDGSTRYAMVNLALRYMKNLLLLSTAMILWYYLSTSLKTDEGIKQKAGIPIYALCAAALIIIVANLFTGCMFEVTDSVYHRGPLMVVFLVVFSAMVGFGSLFEVLSDATKREKFVSVIYFIITLAFVIVQGFNLGLSLAYFAPAIITLIIYVNFYTSRASELAQRESKLKEERFSILVSQMQPHFLYNALSSIIAVKGNPPTTQEALFSFSTVLRNNIEMLECDHPIPMDEEMDHVDSYLDLEKLRFKEKLNVEIDTDDTSFQVPPMTVQALVENSIRHGVTKKAEGGTVKISSKLEDGFHVIRISDDVNGFDVSTLKDSNPDHVGIKLTSKRIEEMVHGTLKVESAIGLGTMITIRIPVAQQKPGN